MYNSSADQTKTDDEVVRTASHRLGDMMRRVDLLLEQIIDGDTPADDTEIKEAYKQIVSDAVEAADKVDGTYTLVGLRGLTNTLDATRVLLENALIAGGSRDA
jgi:hypothetical protein